MCIQAIKDGLYELQGWVGCGDSGGKAGIHVEGWLENPWLQPARKFEGSKFQLHMCRLNGSHYHLNRCHHSYHLEQGTS